MGRGIFCPCPYVRLYAWVSIVLVSEAVMHVEAEAEQDPEESVPSHPEGNITSAGPSNDDIIIRDLSASSGDFLPQILLEGWSPAEIRCSQMQDEDISPMLTALETGSDRPKWDQVYSGRSALKTLWRQWGRLKLPDGILYCQFYDIDLEEDHNRLVVPKIKGQPFYTIFMTFPQQVI